MSDILYQNTCDVEFKGKKPKDSWMKEWPLEDRIEKFFEFCRVFDDRQDSLLKDEYQIFSHRLHWDEHPFCNLMQSVTDNELRLFYTLVFSFSNEHWGTLNKLMEAYWNFSLKNGLGNMFDHEGKLRSLDERRLIDQRFHLITPTALSNILGVDNLNYAINNYDMDLVLKARMIDWDQFGMLVNPSITTEGMFPDPINLARVYEDFLTNTLS
mgnify:CR=1 FL=1